MNTQLAIRKEITPTVLDMAIRLGEVAFKSGICKTPSPAAATAMMLKGYELGFGLMGSFEMVQVIQGNVGLSPKGAMAIMRAHPEIIEDIKINQMYDPSGEYIGRECTIKRKGCVPHTEKFTMEDAKTAGLLKADSGWSKYPENMCKWRSTGFCADVVCPDLTGGLTRFLIEPEIYTGPEISEEDPEISNLVIDAPSTPIAIEAPEETITMESLMKTYTPEQIVAACEGKPLPKNAEELKVIAEKLQTVEEQ
jgi:hypothetical protein